jgi:hypothetical protein
MKRYASQEFSIESINPIDIPKIRRTICNSIHTITFHVSNPFLRAQNGKQPYRVHIIRSRRKKTMTPTVHPPKFCRPIFPPIWFIWGTQTGLVCSLRGFEVGEITGYCFGGVKITKVNLHLHQPSLYAFFDYDNGINMDPYDPATKAASCSTTKKIYQY